MCVPQIWMTYEELAGLLDCNPVEARERAHLAQLDRKISRDGRTRAKLNAELSAIFIERLKSIDLFTDQAVDRLRHVHGLLEQVDRPRRISSWLGRRSG